MESCISCRITCSVDVVCYSCSCCSFGLLAIVDDTPKADDVCEVAEAKFGDQSVCLYLSAAGHDKASSTAPCIAWMIKSVPNDSKVWPLMSAEISEEIVKFSLANLNHKC